MSHMPPTAGPVALALTRGIVSVKDYGALGDGSTDDTDAINRAITAARAQADDAAVLGAAVFFPHGVYLVSETIELPAYTTLKGDSRYTTTIRYSGTGNLFELDEKFGCGFQDMRVSLPMVTAPTTVTAFYLSNSFRATFQRVIVDGNFTTSVADTQSTGWEFRDNAGDSRIIDCDINNLGAGIRTSAIQNYVIGSVFGLNKYGIYGDGGNFAAGMVVQSCTFVGTGATGGTEKHIIVDRSANMWRIIGCWFEGCRVAMQIGATGVGGPTEFGVIGCAVAAVDTAIDLQACSLPYLANITFSTDSTGSPLGSYNDILVDAGVTTGNAVGLRTAVDFDVDPTIFPAGWTVMRRGAMRLPELIDVTDAVTLQGEGAVTFDMSAADVCPAIFKKSAGTSANAGEWWKGGSQIMTLDSFGVLTVQGAVAGVVYVQTGSGSTRWYTGTGSPEGVVTATVGSLFSRTDGGASTTLYVKTSGTGNTGWTAK